MVISDQFIFEDNDIKFEDGFTFMILCLSLSLLTLVYEKLDYLRRVYFCSQL